MKAALRLATGCHRVGMGTLYTLMGMSDVTRALHEGSVTPEGVGLRFAEDKDVVKQLPVAIRQAPFDVSELPIITYLMAREHGLEYDLIPAVVLARPPYRQLVQDPDTAPLKPEDLVGRSVATRSYSVTTVAQVRDVLKHDFGVDPARIEWVSTEPPHVAQFIEPANVRRAANGATPASLLKSGAVVAAVLGGRTMDPAWRPLVPETAELVAAWKARAGGSMPFNHVIAVRSSIAREAPDQVRAIWHALADANAGAVAADPTLAEYYPVGFSACRAGLQYASHMALEQGLIRNPVTPDELVAGCLLDT
jgi:4,5-dihydroxyphthalate decarboxylase